MTPPQLHVEVVYRSVGVALQSRPDLDDLYGRKNVTILQSATIPRLLAVPSSLP
jgi:hypothetical protein